MKIGILSDIHGNSEALKAVLSEAKSLGVSELLICGDFVDYYYSPDEVLSALSAWDFSAILGNHDEYLLKVMDDPIHLKDYTAKYGHGLTEALKRLTPDQKDFFRTLPKSRTITYENTQFHLFHGSPSGVEEYIYPDAPIEKLNALVSQFEPGSVILLGHTHYPFLSIIDSKVILNPGSVGQSRQRGGFASWATYDTRNGSFVFHHTKYDVNRVIKDVEKFDPENSYLKKVLQREI